MTAPGSNAFFYGKGVFTTAAVTGGDVLFAAKHLRRLRETAGKIGLELSAITDDEIGLAAAEKAREIESGRIRITLADRSTAVRWQNEQTPQTGILLHLAAAAYHPPKPLRTLVLSPYQINTTSPLAGLKTCNYLEPLLAFDAACHAGADEAVRLNERGEVASACLANIFWETDGRLFTPSLRTGCVAGTMREAVLERTDCIETEADVEVLEAADAIYLSSAGIGFVAVDEFNGRSLNSRASIADVLRSLPELKGLLAANRQ